VPCYKIENASQKLSAVDRTPLHTKYIIQNLKENQKKEVRLLKQFLIGIECYGAEADVEGFSGYLCEILILKFKTFINLIKQASHWNYGEKFAISNVNIPKFNTPLTFIDPIDFERNVASALSEEKFKLFISACKKYIEKPSFKFFFPNKIKPWEKEKIISEIKKQNTYYIGIILPKPDIIIENLYPQIKKAAKSIQVSSKKYGFNILKILHHVEEIKKEIFIILKLDKENLPITYEHIGPPLKHKKNVKSFIEKWEKNTKTIKKPYKKNDRIYVEIKRDYYNIKDFLINNLDNISLGKHLDKIDTKKIKIVDYEKIITENLRSFWTEYLDGKMKWER
jgi:tRNA nucleotidyltransferase (CCA-adding enzyme)